MIPRIQSSASQMMSKVNSSPLQHSPYMTTSSSQNRGHNLTPPIHRASSSSSGSHQNQPPESMQFARSHLDQGKQMDPRWGGYERAHVDQQRMLMHEHLEQKHSSEMKGHSFHGTIPEHHEGISLSSSSRHSNQSPRGLIQQEMKQEYEEMRELQRDRERDRSERSTPRQHTPGSSSMDQQPPRLDISDHYMPRVENLSPVLPRHQDRNQYSHSAINLISPSSSTKDSSSNKEMSIKSESGSTSQHKSDSVPPSSTNQQVPISSACVPVISTPTSIPGPLMHVSTQQSPLGGPPGGPGSMFGPPPSSHLTAHHMAAAAAAASHPGLIHHSLFAAAVAQHHHNPFGGYPGYPPNLPYHTPFGYSPYGPPPPGMSAGGHPHSIPGHPGALLPPAHSQPTSRPQYESAIVSKPSSGMSYLYII